jgi:hypothetical protein
VTITFTNGSITSTSSEQTICDISGDEHYSLWIFTHNMTTSETVRIKVYVFDSNTSTLRIYEDQTISGVQAKPAYYIPWIPAREFKVTIQRTAGSDKAYSWLRAEVV